MNTNYLIYAGIFALVYFLVKFIMTNRSVDKKITDNIQEVVNSKKYKVKGRFE